MDEPYLPQAATASHSGSLFGAYTNRRLQTAEVLALIRGEVDAIYVTGGRGPDLEALLDVDVVFDIGAAGPTSLTINNITPAALTVSGALLDERPDLVDPLRRRQPARGALGEGPRGRDAADHRPRGRHRRGLRAARLPARDPRATWSRASTRSSWRRSRTSSDFLLAHGYIETAFDVREWIERARRRLARTRPRPGGPRDALDSRCSCSPALTAVALGLAAGCGSRRRSTAGRRTAAAGGGGDEPVTVTVGVPRNFGFLTTLWARDVQPEGVQGRVQVLPGLHRHADRAQQREDRPHGDRQRRRGAVRRQRRQRPRGRGHRAQRRRTWACSSRRTARRRPSRTSRARRSPS